MFRPTTPQSSLFDPTIMFPGILPDVDWSFTYRDKIYPYIDEEKFRHIFSETGGAPNKSIKTQISLLIFMGIEVLNWREAEFQFSRRIDWMIATSTGLGEANIDHTTLFKFYQRLEQDDTAYELFKDLTVRFITECKVSFAKQRTDSFFMDGWLERLSRYGLFKETIRVFLQNLRKQKPGLYENIKSELSREYLEKDFDLTEKDKEKANRKIGEMAQDLYRLKTAFENHHQVKHYASFKILVEVFGQQCNVKEVLSSSTNEEVVKISKKTRNKRTAGRSDKEEQQEVYEVKNDLMCGDGREEIREKSDDDIIIKTADSQCAENSEKEKKKGDVEIEIKKIPEGEKIISTPHNTDAEYTKKGDQKIVGHKGFLTETCDPENEVQFVTDVNLERAKHADSKEILKIEDRLEGNGLQPEKLNGDAGFVNGESILESEARGINLVGPSSGRSQSKEEYNRADRPLDIADFKVEINDETKELKVLSCPNGQDTLDQRRSDKTGQNLVHFDRSTCSQCEVNEQCPVKIGAGIATLTVSEAQYAGAARHHQYMENSDYRKECGVRAGVESLVNEIANGHGARKARHRSEKRCRLQLIFASIGCNVKRFINYVVNCAQNQAKMAETIV